MSQERVIVDVAPGPSTNVEGTREAAGGLGRVTALTPYRMHRGDVFRLAAPPAVTPLSNTTARASSGG